jgi:membrane protease YdiL (CAAX protease family)
MEANLAGEKVAGRPPTFPYSNWGPAAAVLGVILALGAGIVMGVPALLLGVQHGTIERFDAPALDAAPSFSEGDSTDLAVGADGTVYADRETKVSSFDADGQETAASRFGDFDNSHGIAVESGGGKVYVSDQDAGTISAFEPAAGVPRLDSRTSRAGLPAQQRADFEPERLALAGAALPAATGTGAAGPATAGPGAAGDAAAGPAATGEEIDPEAVAETNVPFLYVVDRGNDAVVEFSANGAYVGRLTGPDTPAGEFGFDDYGGPNGIAVDQSSGSAPGAGNVYVVAGDSGAVWGFDRTGAYLWELTDDSDYCGVAVDGDGNLWLADSGGGVDEYAPSSDPGTPPRPTGRSADSESDACAVALDSAGNVFVAREADNKLTTGANVVVQIATVLGFLLVPMALASMRGATSMREILARLGVRAFRLSALKWMAATVVAYLVFANLYSLLVVTPEQEDIAKGFGAIPVQVLLIVVLAPISEEVCFRGMLFGGLREKMPRIAAALLSGVIFGGLHALTGVSAVPPLIVFGFLLALLYEKTGSVVPAVVLHVLNNSVALLGQ